MVLPSKDEYPDYYDVIQEPIDLTLIKEKMDTNAVSSLYPYTACWTHVAYSNFCYPFSVPDTSSHGGRPAADV